jgi:hypothetical protein
MARLLLGAARMARLDSTAIWFRRGEDEEAMAEMPSANGSEPRRLPTMVWVAGAVALSAAIFGGIIVHLAHAARVNAAPLAIPAAAPAPAPAAAPTTQPQATPPATAQPPATPQPQATPPAPTSQAAKAPAATELAAAEKLLRHGRPAAALVGFQQTLAQNPDDARALRGACVSLGRLGRANDAARACQRGRSLAARRG